MIDICYQIDSNIPFDRIGKTAQNQPPWPLNGSFLQAGKPAAECKVFPLTRKFFPPSKFWFQELNQRWLLSLSATLFWRAFR